MKANDIVIRREFILSSRVTDIHGVEEPSALNAAANDTRVDAVLRERHASFAARSRNGER